MRYLLSALLLLAFVPLALPQDNEAKELLPAADKKPPSLTEVQRVSNLVYAPDGSFVLLKHDFDSLGGWDTKTGQFRVKMAENAPRSWDCIAISPDGKKAAAIDFARRHMKLWDVATGKVAEEQTLPEWRAGQIPPLLAFSADGACLYSIWDKRILEVEIGGKNRLLAAKLDDWCPQSGSWAPARSAFDPHAKLLILAQNNDGKPGARLGFFPVAKGAEPRIIPVTNHILSLALSPDGKTLAISYDARFTGKPQLELWDVATFKRRATLTDDARKHVHGYHQMLFAPNGKTLAGVPFFTDRSERMLDVLDLEGKLLQEIPGTVQGYVLAFSPDGKTLAAAAVGPILFIDPATGETSEPQVARKPEKEKKPRVQNDAEKLFRAMEKKITDAKALQVALDLEIRAIEGKEKESRLKDKTVKRKGALLLLKENGNKARQKISGNWFDLEEGGEETTVSLVSDGRFVTMKWGENEEKTRPAPKDFHHVLATLALHQGVATYAVKLGYGSGPPDFQPFWAQIDGWNFKEGAPEKVGGRQARVVSYEMGYTEGDNAADPVVERKGTMVTVWIESRTLLPLKHVIAWEGHRWTETYTEFTLDPKIGAKAFELTPAPGNDAEKLFRAMEDKINGAKAIHVAFDIETTGKSEEGKLKGSLLFTKDNKARLTMSGNEGGENVRWEMVSDGKQMKAAESPDTFDKATVEPTLTNLHDRLSTMVSRPGLRGYSFILLMGPIEIDAKTLYRVADFEGGAAEKVGGRDAKVITYNATIKTLDAGRHKVTLWIDAETLLPLKRVIVPEGLATRMTEICTFNLNPKVGSGAFALPK